MINSPDLVLEVTDVFTRCSCGGHVRLLRESDGALVVEHRNGMLICVHHRAIVIGISQWLNADFIRN